MHSNALVAVLIEAAAAAFFSCRQQRNQDMQ
jgi:hypothetical protein